MGETIGYIKRYNNNTTFVVEVIPDNSNGLLNKIKKRCLEVNLWYEPRFLDIETRFLYD